MMLMMIVMTTMTMKPIITTKIAKYKIKSRVACLVRRVCGCRNSVKLNQTQKRTNGQRDKRTDARNRIVCISALKCDINILVIVR